MAVSKVQKNAEFSPKYIIRQLVAGTDANSQVIAVPDIPYNATGATLIYILPFGFNSATVSIPVTLSQSIKNLGVGLASGYVSANQTISEFSDTLKGMATKYSTIGVFELTYS